MWIPMKNYEKLLFTLIGKFMLKDKDRITKYDAYYAEYVQGA